MQIENLWDKAKGQTIYIVGTGPSMRVFPLDFLNNKLTIGLNQAWKYCRLDYCLTVHPELYYESNKKDQWIVKLKDPMVVVPENIYWFHTNHHRERYNYKTLTSRTKDYLYLGRGVQTTALTLAAHMGAKTAVMVGCDMVALGDEHHAHDQDVQFHGLTPSQVYREYWQSTKEVKGIVKRHWDMDVLTLTPFLGLCREQEEYRELKEKYPLPDLPKPRDVSTYVRKEVDSRFR